jgi:hypothetical protein
MLVNLVPPQIGCSGVASVTQCAGVPNILMDSLDVNAEGVLKSEHARALLTVVSDAVVKAGDMVFEVFFAGIGLLTLITREGPTPYTSHGLILG